MKYKEFSIVDVAYRCGIPIDDKTLNHDEVEATCPFCGDHGPGKYHLSLNKKRNIFRCQLCPAVDSAGNKNSGNSVTLYARCRGISNKQAVEELEAGSNVYQFPTTPAATQREQEAPPKPVVELNAVFHDMIQFLTLTEKHREDLRRRGLSDARITRNEYRSTLRTESARRRLAAMLTDFHDLNGVPGFFMTDDGVWSMSSVQGLLIPIRDSDGAVQGLQIRLDSEANPKRKYRWLSTRYYKSGTRSFSKIHVTGNRNAKVAYLTEGGLKGDVASFLDRDALFICVAGVNALNGLKEILTGLELEQLVVTLDMDKVYKPNVQAAVQRITQIVSSIRGLKLKVPNWNPEFKGIDDYFLAKAVKGYRPQRYQPTPISTYLSEVWAKEYPNCDEEFIALCEWEPASMPVTALRCVEPTREEDMEEVARYRKALHDGAIPFPPLVSINGDVAEGKYRYWALRMEGYETVEVYQNRLWQQAA